MFSFFYRVETPNVDRLDAENAQFRPENRILHAKLCIYTGGKVIILPTYWFFRRVLFFCNMFLLLTVSWG